MCLNNRERTLSGQSQPIGKASEYERAFLTPLAEEGYPIEEIIFPLVVDGHSRVKVKSNWYSAPVLPGNRVTASGSALVVSIIHDNRTAAEHPRQYGRGHQILNLEHILMFWSVNPGRWLAPRLCSNGGRLGVGRHVWTGYGSSWKSGMARAKARGR